MEHLLSQFFGFLYQLVERCATNGSVISERLAGRRIAVTGATGFVGTALVERLLRSVPDCTVVLLVRNGRRTSAVDRVRKEILKNNAFDRLRAELGADFDATMARRLSVVAGDVGTDGLGLNDADRTTFATCDVIIHSAASVSFDSPLDSAVEVNLLGPTRIANLLNDHGPRDDGTFPHLVAVSTCYVAGNRRGTAPEELVSDGPFDIGLNWRTEVAAARRLRGDSEAASRLPENLARFRSGRARNSVPPERRRWPRRPSRFANVG
jgi:nucleoside-diphosphate-sugar epimerase